MELGVDLVLAANLVRSRLDLKNQAPQVTSLEVRSAGLASERPSQVVVANEFAKKPALDGVKLQLLAACRCLVHERRVSDSVVKPRALQARWLVRLRRRGLLRSRLPKSLPAVCRTQCLPSRPGARLLSWSKADLAEKGPARSDVARRMCKRSCVQLVSACAPARGSWPVFGLVSPASWSLAVSEGPSSRRLPLACTFRSYTKRDLVVPHYPTPLWQDFCGLVVRFAVFSQSSKLLLFSLCCEAATRSFNCQRPMHSQLAGASFSQALLTFEPLNSDSFLQSRYSAGQLWKMVCKQSCIHLVAMSAVYPMQRKVRYAGMVMTASRTHLAEPRPVLLCKPYTALSMTKLQISAGFNMACHESVKDVALCSSRCFGAEKHLPVCCPKQPVIRERLTRQPHSVPLRRLGHPCCLAMPSFCAGGAEPIASRSSLPVSSWCHARSRSLLRPLTHGQHSPTPLWKMFCKHSSIQLLSSRAVHPMQRKLGFASGFVLTASSTQRAEALPFLRYKPCRELGVTKLEIFAGFHIACHQSLKEVALCSSRCSGAERHLPVCRPKQPVIRESSTPQPLSLRTVLLQRWGHACLLALPASCAERAEQIVCKSSSLAMSQKMSPISKRFGSLGLDRSGRRHRALTKIVSRKLVRARRVKVVRKPAGACAARECVAEYCDLPRRWSEHGYRESLSCSGAQLSSSAVSLMTPAALLCSLLKMEPHPSAIFQMVLVQCRDFALPLDNPGFASRLPTATSCWELRAAWEQKVQLQVKGRCTSPSSSFKTLGVTHHTSQMPLTTARLKVPQSSVASLNHSHSILACLHMKDFCSRLCLAEHHGQRDYPVLLGRGSSSKLLVSEEGTPSAWGLSLENFKERGMPANRTLCLDVQMSFRGMRLRKLPK